MTARFGPYRVVETVERRGPFAVLRAEHEQLGHEAWIRTTAEHVVRREELDAAVLHEARVVAGLGPEVTPGVLEVLSEGDRVAVAYRAPEGPSLRTVLEKLRRGAASLVDAAATFAAASRAVAAMHEAGVAHLALCPERMHLTRTGAVVIVDFLHAARLGADSPAPDDRLDLDPAALAYRAPEQILGERGDRASDVFALGLLGHELVAGGHPFGDEPAERARRVRHDEPPRLELDEGVRFGPSLGRDLEAILLRALAKPPALRPATAVELARELEALGRDVVLGDARGLLSAAGFQLGHAPRAAPATPPAVGRAALRLGAIAAAMLGVAVLVGRGGDEVDVGARAARGGTPGRLVVLAAPWAEVHLDGKRLDVTPIGRPVEVRPGAHELVFRHPAAVEERRAVDVPPGQTVTVDVTMKVRRIHDAGVDASP